MNNIFLYDGSFISLMSLVASLLYLNKEPINIVSEEKYDMNLLYTPINLKIKNKRKKIDYLKYKTSKKIFNICYYVYLSSDNNKEMIIYDFVKNSYVYGDTIFSRRNIISVNKMLNLKKNVSFEAHRLKGFLSFKKMNNNFYYAEINPTNNVLLLLVRHFKNRLKNEYFVIKDVNRNIYAFYDKNKVKILSEEDILYLKLNINKSEDEIIELWKTFFKTISIKERKNKKCQMQNMPKKYWKYIIEKDGE